MLTTLWIAISIKKESLLILFELDTATYALLICHINTDELRRALVKSPSKMADASRRELLGDEGLFDLCESDSH